MERRFTVKPLPASRIDTVFPLVQAAMPGLTLAHWRQFAANAATPTGSATSPGILVVENERGYIQGFCTFRVQHDLRHGTIIAVDDLVALDLVNGEAVAAALVQALEERARRLGCGAVQLHVDEEPQARHAAPTLCEYLKRQGHVVEAIRLVKAVDLPS